MSDPIKNMLERLSQAGARAAEKVQRAEAFAGLPGESELRSFVGSNLKDRKLILVSNREPYAHVRRGDHIECIRSAGGLTIALDSMAAACGATWICHGGANADFEPGNIDEKGYTPVPPKHPTYRLRRIHLSPEEERGYYEGFSNETLWPLCHVCYVRPKFDLGNWKTYQAVNEKFAQAIAAEAEPGAIVFLQDYHLAMAGSYIKALRQDITTVLFWHIPWPNPEIFRICPWKKELLEGLLANDILGFHLPYHAQNFIDTVDLELECQIDREDKRIRRGNFTTRVRPYPISIDFSAIFQQAEQPATRQAARALREEYGLEGVKIGLGVDRLDYTKGIPERLEALERLFEREPRFVGKFSFVQIGVPSRTDLEDYQQVVSDIEDRCGRLNLRFATKNWRPVIFLKGHQDFDRLIPFYQLADLCVVSALHDGMNLVAKEFVAASSNDKGVLVLSRFTGSARELEQGLLVNPYDVEALCDAMVQALDMPADEQKARLTRMRERVARNNVYSWAQVILDDVVQLAKDSQLGGA